MSAQLKQGDIDNEFDDDVLSTDGKGRIQGVIGSDGVMTSVLATGHVNVDELHAHQMSLHAALFGNAREQDALETDYQREFADVGDDQHVTFVGTTVMGPLHAQLENDHFDFHHEEEDAGKLLLRGIDVAQQQNHAGLVHLYRGQKMFLDGNFAGAAAQFEKSVDFYRPLHLSDVGSDTGSHGSSRSSASSRSRSRNRARSRQQTKRTSSELEEGVDDHNQNNGDDDDDEDDDSSDRLDFSPHVYSLLVETYYNLPHYNRAISVAREWIAKYPKNVSPYCSLAWVQMKQSQYKDSISTCTDAIKRLPETEGMLSLYSIRGKCREALGQYEEAVGDFQYVKQMARKDLARFAPEKPAFAKIERAPRPFHPGFAPKSRPDITMRRKITSTQRLFMGGSGGSGVSGTAAATTAPSSMGTADSKDQARQVGASSDSPKPAASSRRINYEVHSEVKRQCAKCTGKRDPVTKHSVTTMRSGLSTDERRGASPSRLLLSANTGLFC